MSGLKLAAINQEVETTLNLTSTTEIPMESSASANDYFVAVVSVLSQLAMVFGGVVPYIPQYRAIRRSGSTKGFSLSKTQIQAF